VVGPRRVVRALESVPTVRESLVISDTQPIAVALDTARVRGRVRPVRVTVSVGAELEPAVRDSLARDSLARDSAAVGAAPQVRPGPRAAPTKGRPGAVP